VLEGEDFVEIWDLLMGRKPPPQEDGEAVGFGGRIRLQRLAFQKGRQKRTRFALPQSRQQRGHREAERARERGASHLIDQILEGAAARVRAKVSELGVGRQTSTQCAKQRAFPTCDLFLVGLRRRKPFLVVGRRAGDTKKTGPAKAPELIQLLQLALNSVQTDAWQMLGKDLEDNRSQIVQFRYQLRGDLHHLRWNGIAVSVQPEPEFLEAPCKMKFPDLIERERGQRIRHGLPTIALVAP